jgi:DNA-binding transcriptional MerR regulator
VNGKVCYDPTVTQPASPTPAADPPERLLRIQEVSAETGLTPRTIRYYEELGLLAPAGRSDGAYRLSDAEDLERLRFIRGLRDDAGFSLAEIGQLLEDEQARTRNRVMFRTTTDRAERHAILRDALERIDRQVVSLRGKIGRLEAMVDEAEERRAHLLLHLDDVEAGREPTHTHARAARACRAADARGRR